MTGREKVVQKLEEVIAEAVYPDRPRKFMMPLELAEDAIALLKAQEPRVMTLEEVQALCANDVVWLEDKGKPNIIPGIVRNRHLWPHSATMVTNFMRGDGCKVTADDDDYGKRWRCWTFCPTGEQREVTPWN